MSGQLVRCNYKDRCDSFMCYHASPHELCVSCGTECPVCGGTACVAIAQSEQPKAALLICGNASKCPAADICGRSKPHEEGTYGPHTECAFKADTGRIAGSKCIPYVENGEPQ